MKKLLFILVICSVLLAGCLGGVKNEKQAFIDATVEATCLVFQADNIFDPALEQQAIDIYKNYGFDADDEEAMTALTEKYQEDADVQAAITQALEECAGDFAEAFADMAGELETPVAEEEAVVEEEESGVKVEVEAEVVE